VTPETQGQPVVPADTPVADPQPPKILDPAVRDVMNVMNAENNAALQKNQEKGKSLGNSILTMIDANYTLAYSGIQLPPRRFIDPKRSAQLAAAMKRLQRGKVDSFNVCVYYYCRNCWNLWSLMLFH
jgi:hypothetical protein